MSNCFWMLSDGGDAKEYGSSNHVLDGTWREWTRLLDGGAVSARAAGHAAVGFGMEQV